MKNKTFFDKIILFLKRFFNIDCSPIFKEIKGTKYTLRIFEDLSASSVLDSSRSRNILRLNHHSAKELHYWAEALKTPDILLEGTRDSYKVRYLSFSAWSLLIRNKSKPDFKSRQYTHVFCVWNAGRFKNGKFILGEHLISIPVDLGIYGDRFISSIALETSKSLLDCSDISLLDWETIISEYKRQYPY